MIARLVGTVVHRDVGRAVVDVRDVGYLVQAATRDLDAWVAQTEPVVIWVSTDVREDAILLYGFSTDIDRVAFERLRAVDGVGPKTALAALDVLGLHGLQLAVAADDLRALEKIPGVGKKLAQRLALELKGKLPTAFSVGAPPVPARPAAPAVADDPWSLALDRLGYSRAEITRARDTLAADPAFDDASVPDRLRAALRVLSGGQA